MSPRHIWTSREVCRALEALGFVLLPRRGKGSHSMYSRNLVCLAGEPVNITVSVPHHLGLGTARSIADRVGLTLDQLYDALTGRMMQQDYEAMAATQSRRRFLPPALR
jgi:predicted RNA binding protein YcfA (HicA-like mRNA interferase family)